jgi:glycosyltransferase involved in cell wall biosynthesis
MIYANYPDLMDESAAFLQSQRDAVIRADHIICISQETERDLLERIPQVAGKTSVIYLASSFECDRQRRAPQVLNSPKFLYVGGRAAYKNFSLVLRAFAAAARAFKQIRLCIAGAPLADHERWQIHYLGISHLVDVHVFPDEPTLQELYFNSVALLYPSKHEGFGIPPLEAMSCGTVAVTANTTSLPEVVGDGGIMLDPGDEQQWTDCILGLVGGSVNRERIIARGFDQVARFSWDTTAVQHIEIYQKLST